MSITKIDYLVNTVGNPSKLDRIKGLSMSNYATSNPSSKDQGQGGVKLYSVVYPSGYDDVWVWPGLCKKVKNVAGEYFVKLWSGEKKYAREPIVILREYDPTRSSSSLDDGDKAIVALAGSYRKQVQSIVHNEISTAQSFLRNRKHEWVGLVQIQIEKDLRGKAKVSWWESTKQEMDAQKLARRCAGPECLEWAKRVVGMYEEFLQFVGMGERDDREVEALYGTVKEMERRVLRMRRV